MGRGLSQLQKDILAEASKGYITPTEATECAWKFDDEAGYETKKARASATASRALRSLEKRNLLVYVRHYWVGYANLYMLKGWEGPLPRILSRHVMNFEAAMTGYLGKR
jgi:hypothetical protein